MSLLFVSVVFAQGSKPYYIGLGYFYGEGDSTVGSSSTNLFMDGFDLKFGLGINENNRIELGYTQGTVDFTRDHDYTAYDIDWVYLFEKSSSKLRPFVTAGISLMTYKDAYKQYSSGVLTFVADAEGMAINIGGGIVYKVSNTLELETALEYKKMDWDSFSFPASTSSFEIEQSVFNLHIGVHYLF